jgi:hypothetical protein
MTGGGAHQHLERMFRIVLIADPHRQFQANLAVRIAPVDDRAGNQILIRHQRLHAIAVADHHIASAQRLYPAETLGIGAGQTGKADDIARLDRLVHQQHKTADKIAGDGLQSEAQPIPIAPVSTVSAVRSTPAALIPSSTPRLTRKK